MESNTSTTTTNDNNQNQNHNEASREEAAGRESNHNEASREEAAGRELVVRRHRVRVLGLSASLSQSSSSSTHDNEIIAEYPITYEVVATVTNIYVTINNRGSSILLPTDDDEESLRPDDLPIEVIEGLLKKVEVIDNGDVCAICMDELKVNDEARAIGHCSHTFHLDCVSEWVKRKPTCPLCRFEIPINGEGGDDQGVKRRRLI